jgi:hypothetical protein
VEILFACFEAKRLERIVRFPLLCAGTDPDIYRQDVFAAQNILITILV